MALPLPIPPRGVPAVVAAQRRRYLRAPVRQHHAVQPALAGEHEQRHCDDQTHSRGRRDYRSYQAAQRHRQCADGESSGKQADGEVGPRRISPDWRAQQVR